MRLAAAGVYNNMAFHRVAPGFVIQTGSLNSRSAALSEKQQKLVHNLAPEFNDTKHVKGIVSMARGEATDSATTSFFICTGTSRRSTASTPPLAGSSTGWQQSRRSRLRRATAKHPKRGSTCDR